MARKVLLWGMGNEYENLINSIFEIHKGNIIVEAVVCKADDIFASKRDGFRIVTKKDVKELEFDYVLVTSRHYYGEIKKKQWAKEFQKTGLLTQPYSICRFSTLRDMLI
ncbi:MAG: hypothetical protein K2P76_16595 [Lachnospiraceae bacterium]|nr:hypothetical protein [Lachnospiraceae bacterium]MDE6980109.1 hypothetical protein [Lachnospiraceae bacterium]